MSTHDLRDQTVYALNFAEKVYNFFTEYFQIPEVVPKAGKRVVGSQQNRF